MRGSLSSGTIDAIVEGRHADPFAVLGLHDAGGSLIVRAFVPGAQSLDAVTRGGALLAHLEQRHPAGYFEGRVSERTAYRLRATNRDGAWTVDDPYAYGPVLGAIDDWLLGQGTHVKLYDRLGAHLIAHEGTTGIHFAVWAPNARRVSIVGDFNAWDGRRHVMRKRVDTGVWEIFVPGLAKARSTSTKCSAPTTSCCRSRPTPSLSARSCARQAHRWSATPPRSPGPMANGWRRAGAGTHGAGRFRFTKCIWAHGAGAKAIAGSPTTSSPTRSCRMPRTWASRTSS
jgi:hypothetical protein